MWGEFVASMLTDGFLAVHLTQLGWVSLDTLQAMCTGWRQWGQHVDAFFADAAGEAVGWVELPWEKGDQ